MAGKTILNTKALKYNNVFGGVVFFMYPEIQQNSFSVWINVEMMKEKRQKERIYGNIYNTSGFHHTTGDPLHGLI